LRYFKAKRTPCPSTVGRTCDRGFIRRGRGERSSADAKRLFRNDHRGDSPSALDDGTKDLGADRHVSFSGACTVFVVEFDGGIDGSVFANP